MSSLTIARTPDQKARHSPAARRSHLPVPLPPTRAPIADRVPSPEVAAPVIAVIEVPGLGRRDQSADKFAPEVLGT
jgi:hypothetical protein